MTREPIIIFESEDSTGVDKIPIGTVIFVNNVYTTTGMAPQYFVITDRTGLDGASTIADLLSKPKQYQRIGHQPHAYNPGYQNLQLRMDVLHFVTIWHIPSDGYTLVFPVVPTATYNCEVNWGDGTIETITSSTDPKWNHVYTTATNTLIKPGYRVTISGEFGGFCLKDTPASKDALLTVSNLGETKWTNLRGAFTDAINLTSFTSGKTDSMSIIDWSDAFMGCKKLTGGFDNLNVSSGENFNNMFKDCESIEFFHSLSTSNGLTFQNMFNNCLNAICLGGVDTTSQTDTTDMFLNSGFTNPDKAEQATIELGSIYQNTTCPKVVDVCITMDQSGSDYGYIVNSIGKCGNLYTDNGLYFHTFIFNTNGDIHLKYGELGNETTNNLESILVFEVQTNSAFGLTWNAAKSCYYTNNTIITSNIIDAYNLGQRDLCFDLNELSIIVISYDFKLRMI